METDTQPFSFADSVVRRILRTQILITWNRSPYDLCWIGYGYFEVTSGLRESQGVNYPCSKWRISREESSEKMLISLLNAV